MSIGYFYNCLDWTNKNIIKHIKKSGIKVEPININEFVLDIPSIRKFKHNLYINRVYPSSNIDSYNNLRFMLEITKHIENLKLKIINPFFTAFLDYSKTEGNNVLEKAGIPTPRTLLVANKDAALKIGKTIKFPKVIKMDSGGRALNVFLVKTYKEYKESVSKLIHSHHIIHIEEYIKPQEFITRLFILNHKFQVAYKRIIGKGEWLGSASQGSEVAIYPEVSKEVIKLGELTSRKLNSKILGLDIIETSNSAYVIDVNPTPVFNEKYPKMFGFDPTKSISEYILSEYLCTK